MTEMSASSQMVIISGMLQDLAADIEELGATLCQAPTFAGMHICELQSIDLIAQKQRCLASLLDSGLTEASIESVGIDVLRERLTSLFWGAE